MMENEVVDLKLSERLLNLMLDEKVTFEKKKGKMDYLIRIGADVNEQVYGKSLALWLKELGDEETIKYVKENGGIEQEISKEIAKELGEQFWDDYGNIKSVKEIKELVLMGADLSVKNNNDEQIWKYLSIEDMSEILKDLPRGYVIEGDVDLSEKGLIELPDFSKIMVGGYFGCSFNWLTDLKGAPSEVGGSFYCNENQLTSLEGAPEKVGGYFNCRENQLTTLEGAPSEVGGSFYCDKNQLTSLEGTPSEVGLDFYCSNNQLTSLEGAPEKVGGDFGCSSNRLTDLKGAPSEVGGDFICSNNHLETLNGAPLRVEGSFFCNDNKLVDLKYAPKEVGGNFICKENQLESLEGKPEYIDGKFGIEDEVLKKFEEKENDEKDASVFKRIFGGKVER